MNERWDFTGIKVVGMSAQRVGHDLLAEQQGHLHVFKISVLKHFSTTLMVLILSTNSFIFSLGGEA